MKRSVLVVAPLLALAACDLSTSQTERRVPPENAQPSAPVQQAVAAPEPTPAPAPAVDGVSIALFHSSKEAGEIDPCG